MEGITPLLWLIPALPLLAAAIIAILRRPHRKPAAALAIGAGPVRVIGFADRLRPDARAALAELAALGVEASILSGDNAAAVAITARETRLTGQAAALPVDKLEAIRRLQDAGRRVLMVGLQPSAPDGSAAGLRQNQDRYSTKLLLCYLWS
jgi:hypothetical protein